MWSLVLAYERPLKGNYFHWINLAMSIGLTKIFLFAENKQHHSSVKGESDLTSVSKIRQIGVKPKRIKKVLQVNVRIDCCVIGYVTAPNILFYYQAENDLENQKIPKVNSVSVNLRRRDPF